MVDLSIVVLLPGISLFSLHTLWGLAYNPLLNFEFGHHTCLSNNSLISPLISTKLVSVFVLCMLYKSNNFQVKVNTLTYMRVTILMKHLKLSPERLRGQIFLKLLSETNILM